MIATLDPVAAIDGMLDAGEDIWEAAIDAATEDEQDMAARRWRLGDLALRVQKAYGKNRIGDFAKQINVPVPTVKQYRRMSDFYPQDTRYLFENVGYSHYRAAIGLKELGAALELLTESSLLGRTVEDVQINVSKLKGKPTPPMKLWDGEAVIERVDVLTGEIVLYAGRGADLSQLCNGDIDVRVKIYEVKEAA